MKSLNNNIFSLSLVATFAVLAIASGSQKLAVAFVAGESNDAGWASVLISDKITYALAWDDVSSVITKRFEIEMISKESGYIRTKWKYNWTTNGHESKEYRVRVTIKMSEQRKKIDINAEAEKLIRGVWVKGSDTQLLETTKKDIAGLVGS
jgi:uncharacterized lipoprotein